MALDVALLRQSFELVATREPQLTHRFYDHLFAKYPEVRPLFSRNTRDKQEQMLRDALVAVMDHLEDAPWLDATLRAMGAKHAGYGVTEPMYGMVGDALLTTLGEIAGDAWTPALKQAWTDAFGAIAGLMQKGAREAAAA